MAPYVYTENFEDGPGGWCGWKSNAEGLLPLRVENGALVTRGPWWIDYNHAPPDGGYMNLLYALATSRQSVDSFGESAGVNRLVQGDFPNDWRHARLTVRIRAEDMELRGTQLYLLAQAKVGQKYVNSLLIKQPIPISSDWNEHTITLVPDEDQWRCLGSHVLRTDRYGWGTAEDVLKDLNCDIILVLFSVDVIPAEPVQGNYHHLRAGEDYAVMPDRVPVGTVMLDSVRIAFPG